MKLDIHVHIGGADEKHNGNYWNPRNKSNLFLRLFMRQLGLRKEEVNEASDEKIRSRLLAWLEESSIEVAVVLALDGAYMEDGTLDSIKTRMIVSNEYVASIAQNNPRVLFGASVHPYRKDSLHYLEKLIQRGARLVKWIPSAQGIDPLSPKCMPFYELLAHYRIPLLSHTGVEHALSGGDQRLNAPTRLIAALEHGVSVIAAHCGTIVYLYERSGFGEWRRMALEYERFYGDISGFFCPTRMPALRAITRDPRLVSKVIYGSDFPAMVWPTACFPFIGTSVVRKLGRIKNPFDRAYRTLQALGVPDEVFTRGWDLLSLKSNRPSAGAVR